MPMFHAIELELEGARMQAKRRKLRAPMLEIAQDRETGILSVKPDLVGLSGLGPCLPEMQTRVLRQMAKYRSRIGVHGVASRAKGNEAIRPAFDEGLARERALD
jgi:hypothetical protein